MLAAATQPSAPIADIAVHGRLSSNELRVGARRYDSGKEK
jgi:hypothetical protein